MSFSARAGMGCLAALTCLVISASTAIQAADPVVNVYSYREPQLVENLTKAFTEATKIKVNVVYAKDGLIEKMVAEGRNSPADLLLTPESGLLVQAHAAGVTRAVTSPVLTAAIPAEYRETQGHWYALTRRARVVYASKERVAQDAITYAELADPKWKGKICSRSGQHTYNVALIASMIAHLGDENAEKWLRGVKANLARKPAGGDREQVRDVSAGLCVLAIGNTYYMGRMQTNTKAPEQQKWAEAVKVLFPDAATRGTHVNISGVAMAAHAPHAENALKLMEFLVSAEAQRIYAEANFEYPVVASVPASDRVKSWGALKADTLPLEKIASLRKKASELVDKVAFDAGPTN
jgi:iron(III) transport system substrate-binding protein